MENTTENKAAQSAFPFRFPLGPDQFEHSLGLTKRAFFAAMAMQGLASESNKVFAKDLPEFHNRVAKHSLAMADALLKALAESEVQGER
jgi:hypothetical protein